MADTWEALEQACGQCRNCALAETRLHVVFGDGARDAEILLVGEGPGQREDEQGIPFVGPAGLLLDDMQKVASAYTKDNHPDRFVQNSFVLHADEKRTIPLLRTIGFQMPITLQRSDSI